MESDAELMVRTAAGDHDAFSVLVDRHKDRLVNYLAHLSGSRERGEDLAQDAFVKLYENAERYSEQGKLAPYLFRIGTNLYRTDVRRLLRWQSIVLQMAGIPPARAVSPQGELLAGEISRQVHDALERLPLRYRAAVVLREIEEWSYEEIAVALGCNEGTVKSRLNRGREKLRDSLASYWKGVERYERQPAR